MRRDVVRRDTVERRGAATAAKELAIPGLLTASQLQGQRAARKHYGWNFDYLAGHLIEISGGASTTTLTMATRLLVEVQRRGEATAWISAQDSIFFPPDLVAHGVDLDALPVVRVETRLQVRKAAETLLRSGGFALIILDLDSQASMTLAVQTRLASLARQHRAVVLGLTRKDADRPSLGSLFSIRADCTRSSGEGIACQLRVLRDKSRGTGWQHQEICHAPDGMC